MSQALRVADYLAHMLNALERIARYTAGMDQTAYLRSELVRVAQAVAALSPPAPRAPQRARPCA